ncbi:MAG TPA: hypothetical protein VHY91_01425 [Pirellulales bacterium]|nr:hypothetical protein [Pirellulales bacterium]
MPLIAGWLLHRSVVLPIVLAAFPFCFAWFGERILQARGPGKAASPEPSIPRALVFMLFALSTIGVAMISCSTGVPTVTSPFPLLMVLPLFSRLPIGIAVLIPVVWFFVILWPICRSHRGPIPPRATILLGVTTGLSALCLALGWSYGLAYQGLQYTAWVTIINLVLIAALWICWVFLRRETVFGWRIAFGTLLFYWLFWFAFPYLGELP